MPEPLSVGLRLRELPKAELRDALEALVVTRFKRVLLMGDDEELALDASYFDLGLTSLRLAELRKGLEDALGIEIDATVLFNKPTVEEPVGHLGAKLSATGGDPPPLMRRAARRVRCLAPGIPWNWLSC
ncbi:acyl carrier protein [Streptomyces sp. NBC_00190]|uniref:acyl carrier protein n=1 Tax=Streptomyces sp. NBC_00190 TaxID=2903634 RepID=UPI002E2DBD0C|nr:acyl carrier protein [Streptomyces sp. NBC_00190]